MVRKALFSCYSGCPECEYGQTGKTQKTLCDRQHMMLTKSSVSHFLMSPLCSRSSITPTETLSRQDLRKWLSPPDPSSNHNTVHSFQHEGTATWFFQGGFYDEWKSTPSLLWIHGKRMSLFPPSVLPSIDACFHSRLWQERPLVRGFSAHSSGVS